jgi:hypothetical protein
MRIAGLSKAPPSSLGFDKKAGSGEKRTGNINCS